MIKIKKKNDLFNTDGLDIKKRPLAYRMKPRSLKDFRGQEHILGKGKILRELIEKDKLSSMIFFGPSGSGKTALVNIISQKTNIPVSEINAVTAGVADIRKVLNEAKMVNDMHNKPMLLMIDEIHHFNRTQQDALLPSMENGTVIIIGLTTENPYFYVNNAILSRAMVFEFKSLDNVDILEILKRVISNKELGFGEYNFIYDNSALEYIAKLVNGDARYALNILETVVNIKGDNKTLSIDVVKQCFSAVRYDRDGDHHYDIISAFIKSMRGSDPDAVLYWLAAMIEGGEDPRFIARRIAICAAEDVGLAAPTVVSVAQAAWDLVERVGMPEARIILAEAATLVACSPKSNASYLGIDKAISEIREKGIDPVPNHLKDASADGKAFGHGQGYKYPHDYENHFIKQEYHDKGYKGKYYKPSKEGRELIIKERLAKLWGEK